MRCANVALFFYTFSFIRSSSDCPSFPVSDSWVSDPSLVMLIIFFSSSRTDLFLGVRLDSSGCWRLVENESSAVKDSLGGLTFVF